MFDPRPDSKETDNRPVHSKVTMHEIGMSRLTFGHRRLPGFLGSRPPPVSLAVTISLIDPRDEFVERVFPMTGLRDVFDNGLANGPLRRSCYARILPHGSTLNVARHAV